MRYLAFGQNNERIIKYNYNATIDGERGHMATKIAIVEDDQAISQMYRIKFEAEDYEVETAENGALGLELIQQMKPDIVLLDLMMPVMSGEEMLAKLRKTPFGKDLKVIILTNRGEQEIPPEVKELGITALILKADMTPRQVAELVKTKLAEK
jgi:DNA-binding response OmpR family regulator